MDFQRHELLHERMTEWFRDQQTRYWKKWSQYEKNFHYEITFKL